MDSVWLHKSFPMFHVTNVGIIDSQCDNLRPSSKTTPKISFQDGLVGKREASNMANNLVDTRVRPWIPTLWSRAPS
eukprot:1595574-Pyramimonas_sp.AAC.1